MLETKGDKSTAGQELSAKAGVGKPSDRTPVTYELVEMERCKLAEASRALCSICDDLHALANCSSCTSQRREQCRDGLIGLLGDLLLYVLEKFEQEECSMRDSLLIVFERDSCDAHMEDHVAISDKIKWIISSLESTDTVNLSRQLELLLKHWSDDHIAKYDLPLARWVYRQRGAYFKRRV